MSEPDADFDLEASTPWEVLGLGAGASESDVKAAYRRLIRRFRPEQHPDEFRRVRAAFEAMQSRTPFVPATAVSLDEPEDDATGPEETTPPLDLGRIRTAIEEGTLDEARRLIEAAGAELALPRPDLWLSALLSFLETCFDERALDLAHELIAIAKGVPCDDGELLDSLEEYEIELAIDREAERARAAGDIAEPLIALLQHGVRDSLDSLQDRCQAVLRSVSSDPAELDRVFAVLGSRFPRLAGAWFGIQSRMLQVSQLEDAYEHVGEWVTKLDADLHEDDVDSTVLGLLLVGAAGASIGSFFLLPWFVAAAVPVVSLAVLWIAFVISDRRDWRLVRRRLRDELIGRGLPVGTVRAFLATQPKLTMLGRFEGRIDGDVELWLRTFCSSLGTQRAVPARSTLPPAPDLPAALVALLDAARTAELPDLARGCGKAARALGTDRRQAERALKRIQKTPALRHAWLTAHHRLADAAAAELDAPRGTSRLASLTRRLESADQGIDDGRDAVAGLLMLAFLAGAALACIYLPWYLGVLACVAAVALIVVVIVVNSALSWRAAHGDIAAAFVAERAPAGWIEEAIAQRAKWKHLADLKLRIERDPLLFLLTAPFAVRDGP